jgi:hypothetical protein
MTARDFADYSYNTAFEALADLHEAEDILDRFVGNDEEAAKALHTIRSIIQTWLLPLSKQMPDWTPNGPRIADTGNED